MVRVGIIILFVFFSVSPNPRLGESIALSDPQQRLNMGSGSPMLARMSAPSHQFLNPVSMHASFAEPPAPTVQSLDPFRLQEVAAAHGFSLTPMMGVPPSLRNTPSSKKVKKRCAKWPDCPFGDACRFVHPAEMCMNWPKCPFIDSCFYIHPEVPCKFGKSSSSYSEM